jgi:uncharacterized protein (DUF58 family)
MIIPTRRFLGVLAALLVAGVAAALWPGVEQLFGAAAALLAGLALADAATVLGTHHVAAQRSVPGSLPVGVWQSIALRISNGGRAVRRVRIYDHHPAGFDARGLPQAQPLAPGQWVEIRYEVRPLERGEHHFARIEARLSSRLGLWERRVWLGAAAVTRVYPNFAALTKYALFATDQRLSQIGVLQRQRRGEGVDFHQLREYREGDVQRQIDWKATARSRKLISREYQDERDQQVIFVIDCGRRLAARDGELAHFDHLLNAALLLAYVGLRQGDAVGLLTVGGHSRFMAPRKAAATVKVMLNLLYDLQPTLLTTDYYAAALELTRRIRKRALIVFLSNLRDEDEDTLGPALRLLARRHLVLFASLREAILGRALATRVDSFERALTHAAAADYLRQRALAFRRVEGWGALALDVEPAQLPVALVNRYLDIKRAGRL